MPSRRDSGLALYTSRRGALRGHVTQSVWSLSCLRSHAISMLFGACSLHFARGGGPPRPHHAERGRAVAARVPGARMVERVLAREPQGGAPRRAPQVQRTRSAGPEKLLGGSTAVAVVASGATICCASLGDSRAVAGMRGGAWKRLSVDHVTTSPEEAKRVQALGGCLEWGRLGNLPMTRGLGNFNLEADGFTCDPDVIEVPRREVEFVVLASDGLWDVLSEKHCCQMVHDRGPAGVHGDMAKELAEHARLMGSTDDIAVVVAYFPPEGVVTSSIGGS
ncbi:unnamed protein product [Prorocentrum cordatum]|uniref:PPM-type phosphatase domain-containing protein n=1 Tax=Prorocentrum cordatum TaxID=2364126 RepID=A0ABN9X1S8_9DINO|nr:unnamed protein product [Polarella glacialis]